MRVSHSVSVPANPDATLRRRLDAIASSGVAGLAYLAVGVVHDREVVFTHAWGSRAPGIAGAEPYRLDSLIRVASLSKPFVALAVLGLCERGLIDLDADVSDSLGFSLRHPAHPGDAITPRMLLSHTSSLRDGELYSLPADRDLRGFFDPRSDHWDGGAHFAAAGPPGEYYCYCNLGYGVLGTVIERVSGRRFDRYMHDAVLAPMGLGGGFGTDALSADAIGRLVPPYRKMRDGHYDEHGSWVAQTDTFAGVSARPDPVHDYRVGTNATFLSPQGGLRASIEDLLRFVSFMVDPVLRARTAIVGETSIAEMMRSQWSWDPALRNGETYNGVTRLAGLGLFRTTATADAEGSDRLLPDGGPRLWGHHGDAYGFLGGVLFDPDAGYGFCYTIGGTAADPELTRGRFSSYSWWEESIQEAVLTAYPPPSGTG